MNYREKAAQLREEINCQLLPLINADYAYLELPYYENIGDTLIWEGTLRFLEQSRFKCLYTASSRTFVYRELPKTAIILLQGGGNFGDLWPEPHQFRKKVIELYPRNRAIVLPQTVWYENPEKLAEDETFFANHPNVTLCARDKVSYAFMQEHFPNNKVLLVPDMAFFVDFERYDHKERSTGRTLYAKRTDKELKSDEWPEFVPRDAEVHDWPTYEGLASKYKKAKFLSARLFSIVGRLHIISYNRWIDFWRHYFYRPQYIKDCVRFIDQYDVIYSTRLHIAIAGTMMGKQVHILDNSYGKNCSFHETWLKNFANAKAMPFQNICRLLEQMQKPSILPQVPLFVKYAKSNKLFSFPIHMDAGSDYFSFMGHRFDDITKEIHALKRRMQTIKANISIFDHLMSVFLSSCKTMQGILKDLNNKNNASAEKELDDFIIGHIDDIDALQSSLLEPESEALDRLYRVRVKPRWHVMMQRKDLFHPPFEAQQADCRYSNGRFPCLYLGGSLQSCLKEIGFDSKKRYCAVKFKTTRPIRVLVFSWRWDDMCPLFYTSKQEEISLLKSWLSLLPLMMACSVYSKPNGSSTKFSINTHMEYALPQLLMEWIRHSKEIDGIRYYSVKRAWDDDFSKRHVNYTFPAKEEKLNGYDNHLMELFELTEPLTLKQFDAAYLKDAEIKLGRRSFAAITDVKPAN